MGNVKPARPDAVRETERRWPVHRMKPREVPCPASQGTECLEEGSDELCVSAAERSRKESV